MEKENRAPIVKFFDDMEKLFGTMGHALPYANEVHVDSKYQGTEFGNAIVEHEVKHVKRLRQIRQGKNRLWTFLVDWLWDWYDSNRIGFKYDRKRWVKGFVEGLTLALGVTFVAWLIEVL